MTERAPFRIAVLALVCGCASMSAAEPGKLIQREIAFGRSFNLKEYGGPNIEIAVRRRELTYVSSESADFTRLIPVARTNIQDVRVYSDNTATVYGTSSVEMGPTRKGNRGEKKNGVPFPGTRSEMYLLWTDQDSGIRVYFLDTISSINHDTLVIAVPSPNPAPLPPAEAPSKAPSPPTAESFKKEEPPFKPSRSLPDEVLSKELLTWYLRLQKAREALDLKDSGAVDNFNLQAAEYSRALKKAQEARSPSMGRVKAP